MNKPTEDAEITTRNAVISLKKISTVTEHKITDGNKRLTNDIINGHKFNEVRETMTYEDKRSMHSHKNWQFQVLIMRRFTLCCVHRDS